MVRRVLYTVFSLIEVRRQLHVTGHAHTLLIHLWRCLFLYVERRNDRGRGGSTMDRS